MHEYREDIRAMSLHPYYKATPNIGEAKTRFTNEVFHARPAFRPFYEQCIEAYNVQFNSELAAIDVFHALTDPQNMSPDERDAMRKHGADAWAHSTLSERNASGLLQQAAEVLEALLFELTHNTKPIGAGVVTHGVAFDEALKACGNYTRHRAEWVLVDRANATLEKKQYESAKVIAQLIDREPPVSPKQSLQTVLLWPEPMRMCLYSLCDLYEQSKRPYAYFEQCLIDCGHAIIELRW